MNIKLTFKEAINIQYTIDNTIELIEELTKQKLIKPEYKKHYNTKDLQKLSDKIFNEINQDISSTSNNKHGERLQE